MSTDPALIHRCKDLGLDRNVFEKDNLRWLSFGDDAVQSIIDLEEPGTLISPVCRAMLAVLLFTPEPQRVLLLGTGGGALARYFHHRRPAVEGDAVEMSSAVVEIAGKYFEYPGEDRGWRMVVGDAREYVYQCREHYDLIFLDIGDEGASPSWIFDPEFLEQCRRCLRDDGALVTNIIQETAEQFAAALWSIRQAFDLRTVCIPVPDHKNVPVFAFNGVPGCHDPEELGQRVAGLTRQWGLEFDRFLVRMKDVNPRGSGVF